MVLQEQTANMQNIDVLSGKNRKNILLELHDPSQFI